MDFYKTGGGRRFIDGTIPELSRQIERLAAALEKANELKERELGPASPGEVAEEFIDKKGVGDGNGSGDGD